MSIKIKTTKSTYKTGPNAGKETITRTLSKPGIGYSLHVVKTLGEKTYAVVFSSTAVIESLNFNQAMNAGKVVLDSCNLPIIDEMRDAASFATATYQL